MKNICKSEFVIFANSKKKKKKQENALGAPKPQTIRLSEKVRFEYRSFPLNIRNESKRP